MVILRARKDIKRSKFKAKKVAMKTKMRVGKSQIQPKIE